MEIFDGEGGSRTLFPVLEDEKKRGTFRQSCGLAREKLAPRASRLRSVIDLLGACRIDSDRRVRTGDATGHAVVERQFRSYRRTVSNGRPV